MMQRVRFVSVQAKARPIGEHLQQEDHERTIVNIDAITAVIDTGVHTCAIYLKGGVKLIVDESYGDVINKMLNRKLEC